MIRKKGYIENKDKNVFRLFQHDKYFGTFQNEKYDTLITS